MALLYFTTLYLRTYTHIQNEFSNNTSFTSHNEIMYNHYQYTNIINVQIIAFNK